MNIKEFANAIGVSVTTVSNTICGKGRTSDATKEYVKEKMKEYNYTPNINAKRLSDGKSYTVGLSVVVDSSSTTNNYAMIVAYNIMIELHNLGYDMLFYPLVNINEDLNRIKEKLESKKLDAMIYVASYELIKDDIEGTYNYNHPAVILDVFARENIPYLGSVTFNDSSSMDKIVTYAIDNGHRVFGYLGSQFEDIDSLFVTYKASLAKYNLKVEDKYLYTINTRRKDRFNVYKSILLAKDKPSVLFVRSDEITLELLQVASDNNIKIPEDISIFCTNSLDLDNSLKDIIRIKTALPLVAKATSRLCVKLIKNPKEIVEPVFVETKVIEGSSIKKIN